MNRDLLHVSSICRACGGEGNLSPSTHLCLTCFDTSFTRFLARRVRYNYREQERAICETCGIFYLKFDSKQKYCSRKCSYRIRCKVPLKNCIICNKVWQPNRRTAVVCSFECARERDKRRVAQLRSQSNVRPQSGRPYYTPRVKEYIKTCLICDQTFNTNNANKKICSSECLVERHKQQDKRRRKRLLKYGSCIECGKQFIKRGARYYTCSDKCSAARRIKKDRRASHQKVLRKRMK